MRLGIDFGTCFSSAAYMSRGGPTPVKIDYNITSLPSSVYVTEDDDLLLGQDAEDHALDDPSRLRRELKRDLGSEVPYLLGDRRLLPEDLVTLLMARLKAKAEEQIPQGGTLRRAVVTVPAVYEALRRDSMRAAAQKAGFEQVDLLDEPIAAGLWYLFRALPDELPAEGDLLLVYDLGGGTFDAALLRRRGNTFETAAPSLGSDLLGGGNFDFLIFEDMRRRSGPATTRRLQSETYGDTAVGRATYQRALLRVRDDCRGLKHRLTSAREGRLHFEDTQEIYTLTRTDFERMIASTVQETLEICRKLIEGSGEDRSRLAAALLVGGTCRIPYIRSAVRRSLGCPVHLADDPALAVSLGAALHGEALDAAGGNAPPRTGWMDRYRTGGDPFDLFAPVERGPEQEA